MSSNIIADPLNNVPRSPLWGVHRQAIIAADSTVPEFVGAGINTAEWESVWVDIHFKDTGTKTATVRPLFWNPGYEPDGEDYSGGFFEQDVIADIPVIAGDGGHKTNELQTKGRNVFLKFQALGAGAEAHILVSGAVRARQNP